MQINKLFTVAQEVIKEAAGTDGALTRTETKKLPAYMQKRIEAARKTPSTKVSVADAFQAVLGGVKTLPGLQVDLYDAQGGIKAVGSGTLSKAELAALKDAELKDVTTTLWNIAEANKPAPVVRPELKRSDLDAAAKLLTDVLLKADNGDSVMTPVELSRAKISFKGQPAGDVTQALGHAVNRAKNEGGRTLDAIAKVIDDARKEVLAGNTDGNTSVLTSTELSKAKSVLAQALITVAEQYKGAKASQFTTTPEKIFTPRKPFHAPANASAPEYVQALTAHFDAFSNDNKGAGTGNIARYVMGTVEAGGMAKEIEKLPLAFRKTVLKALEARVQQDPNAVGDPQRIYFTPDAAPLMTRLSTDAGIKCNFVGVAAPPKFNYF